MRRCFAILVASLVVAAPTTALAQSDCPPGGWFCEEQAEADDAAAEEDEAEPEVGERTSQPPVVVYEPAGKKGDAADKIIVVERAPPKPPKRRLRREWGFNLHLQGVIMGSDDNREGPPRHPDSGMGGLGFSFRYRPIPHFAFDAGVDFLGGRDWHGNRRRETGLLLNAMIYFNPRSKVQVYTLGGLGFSGASVERVHDTSSAVVEEYGYFGGQLGLGLEFRVGRKTALNLDVLGFLRGRTDEKARFDPEFVDPDTGDATNTSGGGLFRGGVTFYW
jgi:hypothetical protein